MKRIFASALAFVMMSTTAMAQNQDAQTNLDLEAAALVQIAQGHGVMDRSILGLDFSQPFAILNNLKEQVESIKATLLASFDENGNGKIDAGVEAENFKTGITSIVMLFADTNQNGRIDAEDIASLGQFALDKVREQILSKACPKVFEQVEAAGDFLKYRPVLTKLNEVCLAETPSAG